MGCTNVWLYVPIARVFGFVMRKVCKCIHVCLFVCRQKKVTSHPFLSAFGLYINRSISHGAYNIIISSGSETSQISFQCFVVCES